MFKKSLKLHKEDFEAVLKKGKRKQNDAMSLVYIFENNTKAGVVVSKKVEKGAVKRNLLKRRVFSILKKYEEKIKNTHTVVFLKPNTKKLSFSELEKNLCELLEVVENGKTKVSGVE